ncbi:MAG TPA: RluA family pseudouridine synthase [Limnochordales bacterium]|nr:RluA family pseudouridine synthase [Limnochordales bacterium]
MSLEPMDSEAVGLEQGRPFLSFIVEEADDGRVLAHLLRRRWRLSRGLVRQLKRGPYVLRNGQPVPLRERVAAGDRIALYVPPHLASPVQPEPLPLAIVYEDDHVLVLDKPPGVLVHPAHGEQTGTLANGVAHHLAAQGVPPVVAPVTRLDRHTSGLVLFAKHPHAHHALAQALARGQLEREYLALVAGAVAEPSGVIDAPIRRVAGQLTLREVGPGGQRAVTRYRVLAQAAPPAPDPRLPDKAALLAVTLETGRTHQIRVHLAYAGYPLLGDPLYGRLLPGLLERQALHAWQLRFPHPLNGGVLTFTSPLPPDLDRLRERLGLPPVSRLASPA